MDHMQEATRNLIAAIEACPEYRRYENAKQKMYKYPILKKKMDEFRKQNYELQNSDADIFEEADRLWQKYYHIIQYPVVWEYLAAETAFCKMMQKMNLQILEDLDFETGFEEFQETFDI